MGNMILPGTYIQVRPEGLIAPGQVTVGNLGVVGTAAKGTPGKVELLSSYTDAVQKFYNADPWIDGKSNELTLVRALQFAFNFGANNVYAVRVAGPSKKTASIVLNSSSGQCIELDAKSDGTWGNDIGVNIAAADDNAQIFNETHVGNEPAPLSLKRTPIVPSARNRATLHIDATNITKTLTIFYDDTARAPLAGEVKINRATGAMAFGDAILPADKITATYLVDKTKAVKVTILLGQLKEIYTVVDGQNLFDDIMDPLTGSIWVTAAIGILVGIGFWFAAIVGAVAVLTVLALFRYIETRLPSEFYAHHMLRFARDHVIGEEEVHRLIHDHGFTIANLSSRLSESGQQFEYRMTIKSRDRKNAEALSSYLRGRPEVIEFRITPTGD